MTYVARAGRHVGAQHGNVGRPRRLRARARGRPPAHAHLRRRAARHLGAAARHGAGARHAATSGCASARSRDSSTARSARTPRPCSSRSPTRRTTAACSSTRRRDLYAWTSGADEAGLHVIVHAIGDRAIRTLLDIYERVARENGPRDRRFRIEHAQHIAPADMPRFAELGVIASMQPYHAIDDGRWAEQGHRAGARQGHVRLPRRCSTAVPRWRSAATGSSRRRRRSRGSTPPSRAARSTTATPAAGFPSRRSPSRRLCVPTPLARLRASFDEEREGDAGSGVSSPISCSSTATSRDRSRNRFATRA